ncbi:lysophospholipid acyltransferase family protein [Labedaea rhizosphaerae]|uniref:lysophospholipid acyltransferase family protein n=1 Tax=Labedaea rhizosphaerae TaxID=598644 RepID=UPI00105F6557|nr:lysophospholipid acyltransferase family protein [Labedaea rhizosphaerae]
MLYQVVRRVLAPLLKAVFRPHVEGIEDVPPEGPVIFASNHLSFIDSIIIPLIAPRSVSFLAKAEYFEGGNLRQRMAGAFFSAMGAVPVRRGQGRAAVAALDAGIEVLNKGGGFGIYPEGTRSLDGKLHRGHTGVAQLALSTGALVVPVALLGTDKVQPKGKKLPRVHRFTVRFGKPLDFSRYEGMGASPPIRRAVTDEIMYAIMELSGQEYVDSYHKRPDAA